jgi:hypothetical protein
MGFDNLQTSEIIKAASAAGEIVVLGIMVIYVIFSFVLTRRIKIMNLNLKTPYSKSFVVISKIHTIALIVVILLTLLSIKI